MNPASWGSNVYIGGAIFAGVVLLVGVLWMFGTFSPTHEAEPSVAEKGLLSAEEKKRLLENAEPSATQLSAEEKKQLLNTSE